MYTNWTYKGTQCNLVRVVCLKSKQVFDKAPAEMKHIINMIALVEDVLHTSQTNIPSVVSTHRNEHVLYMYTHVTICVHVLIRSLVTGYIPSMPHHT